MQRMRIRVVRLTEQEAPAVRGSVHSKLENAMATRKFTDNEIAMRIVPTRLRWPPPETAKTIAWDKAREAVELLHALMRTVDDGCLQAEQNADLSPEGVARRRQALGRQALSELETWPPLRAAERAITENIDYLEKKITDLPQPPTAVADVMLAQEIRQHIRRQKSRIDVVMRSIPDPRMLGAVLTAPAVLSGLSDAEWNVVRERARTALHPQQAEMQQQLAKSLDDLRAGLKAASRMVRERCQMGDDDSIHEQLPSGLAGVKSEAA
jgi:hypothetical protein